MQAGCVSGEVVMGDQTQLDLAQLRQAYERGENITQLLSGCAPHLQREEIIEIAYDLQAGSYVKAALADPARLSHYAAEIFQASRTHLEDGDVILDCGAGELTSLSALSHHLEGHQLLACDLSLSRLRVGRRYAQWAMRASLASQLTLFVADMGQLPLATDAVDVVITVHALEPNHGREEALLAELLRVAKRRVLLFEPCWEEASAVVRERMQAHGYVRELARHSRNLGAQVLSVSALPNPINPLNPTYCYVLEPRSSEGTQAPIAVSPFVCPKSQLPLQPCGGYLWSEAGGYAYPEIEGIPCLRAKHGVLMSMA